MLSLSCIWDDVFKNYIKIISGEGLDVVYIILIVENRVEFWIVGDS